MAIGFSGYGLTEPTLSSEQGEGDPVRLPPFFGKKAARHPPRRAATPQTGTFGAPTPISDLMWNGGGLV